MTVSTPAVAILGFGNLGSAVARLVSSNGYPVTIWEYDEAVVSEFNNSRENSRYLPGVVFGKGVEAVTDVALAVEGADIVFVTLPARFIRKSLLRLQGV